MPSSHDFLERCDRLAVLGGTFDPFHFGHLAVADAVMRNFAPKRFLFMPAGEPPNKIGQKKTGGEFRFNMVLSSICKYPSYDVSRMEIDRPGASYTVDTMQALREICLPGADIYLCIGADAFLEILTWKDVSRLLGLCDVIVISRPGSPETVSFANRLKGETDCKIHHLDMPLLEISSKKLREKLIAGQDVRCFMPTEAEEYARKYRLYSAEETALTPERFEEVKARIKQVLSARRFLHTLGTIEESERLAEHYGADVNKARWAALLHDCTKEYSASKKHRLCELWNIPLDEILVSNIDITHSLLSSESAKRDYNVQDEDVLKAIRYHTTGNENMSLLDKIIYLADFIDPYRDDYPPHKKIREYAFKDINKAILIGHKHTIEDLKERGKPIHPWSKAAQKELLKGGDM